MIWWHRRFCGTISWFKYGITYQQANCSGCGKRWIK